MIMEFEKYKELLKERLTEKRYFHSLCVADKAKELAVIEGVDENKAYLAGLLHDVMKDTPIEDQLEYLESKNVQLTAIEKASPKLLHAISGAAFVKYELKLDDEIVDAVRYHTTAKANISLFAKIIYMADFSSADRKYPDIEVVRNEIKKSLDAGYEYTLKYTIDYLLKKGQLIHPNTFNAYNDLLLNKEKL